MANQLLGAEIAEGNLVELLGQKLVIRKDGPEIPCLILVAVFARDLVGKEVAVGGGRRHVVSRNTNSRLTFADGSGRRRIDGGVLDQVRNTKSGAETAGGGTLNSEHFFVVDSFYRTSNRTKN